MNHRLIQDDLSPTICHATEAHTKLRGPGTVLPPPGSEEAIKAHLALTYTSASGIPEPDAAISELSSVCSS